MNTVIILSSDKRDVDLLRNAIRTAGFGGNVEVLKSGLKLLDRLQELEGAPPAAVFVDISGAPDGVRLVEWLRLSSRTRRLRVIAIGEESPAITLFTNAWGSQAVLSKPLNAAAVQLLVANLNLGPASAAPEPRSQQIEKLVHAVQASKRLREEHDQLVRDTDGLLAEVKEKKAPFKEAAFERKSISDEHQAA